MNKKILGIFLFCFIFFLLTMLDISNFINISDDTQYLGILIYVGIISIILAMPDEK